MNVEILEAINKVKKGENSNLLPLLYSTDSKVWNNNFILVYGSLRRYQYNYEYIQEIFGKDSLVYIDDVVVQNSVLYDLGPFPAAINVGRTNKTIFAELMYCTDNVYKAIQQMEVGAGYKRSAGLIWIKIPMGTATKLTCLFVDYYVADKVLTQQILDNPRKYPEIPNGDWVNWDSGVQVLETQKRIEFYD